MGAQPALELLAESATRFFLKDVDDTLEFPAGDAPAASVTSRQGGETMTLQRVPK